MSVWYAMPQSVRYILVGVFNTGVGYGIFGAIWLTLGKLLPYLCILALAHFTAVSVSFLTHRYFVFGGTRGHFWAEYLRFQGSYLWLAPQGIFVNWSLVHFLEWSPWLAQATAMATGVATAFLLHRTVVFKGTI